MLLYTLIIAAVFFLLCFPFIHVGGTYYRGLLLIWNKYSLRDRSGGGFINLTPDIGWFERVRRADPLTFRYLDDGYAVDRRHVYYGQRLDRPDVKTFRKLGNGFYGDKKDVRMYGGLIRKMKENSGTEGFDAETFEHVGENFVRDRTGVYYMSAESGRESERNAYHRCDMRVNVFRRAEVVDAETFQHAGRHLFRDKDFGYRAHVRGNISKGGICLSYNSSGADALEIVEAFESREFESLGCYFYKTHKGVYWSDKAIAGADAATFEIFCRGQGTDCAYNFYARDRKNVYYRNAVVEGADPATFRVTGVNGVEGDDGVNRFSFGRKIV